MTNAQAIRAWIAFSIIPGVFLLLILFVIERFNMVQPQPQQHAQPHVIHEQSVGMAIMWRTPQTAGMTPLEVLQSAAKRMQYEQGTELGNDRNAQALIKVMEAIATLEGRQTTTEDGFPIIE